MVDADLVAAKLSELSARVARVRAHARSSQEELAADPDGTDLVSFNLMLCVQISSDLASHIVADEGWRPARSLADGFTRLEQHGVLTAPTAGALRQAVGLRNVVAHGYAGLDVGMLHRAATEGVGDLDAFAREVSAWVRARSDGA
jgi:uncharacterized protein YutE (UPF0331/DUF86 family)